MKFFREPLFHFLAIGAALFILSSFSDGRRQQGDREIVIDEGQVQRLVAGWRATWRRSPSQEELTGLINDYITEEILYREALALGLDKDDMMIRRRLRQKMEFISEDLASQLNPSAEDLQQYLTEHVEYFRIEPETTFIHIYLNPDRRSKTIEEDSVRFLTLLKKDDSNAAQMGDPIPLPHEFEGASLTELVKTFGAGFADSVNNLPVGQWAGPVRSGYGYHLVLVRERKEGRVPELDDVRDLVVREWTSARRREMNESFIRRLREEYTITLDLPETELATAEATTETR